MNRSELKEINQLVHQMDEIKLLLEDNNKDNTNFKFYVAKEYQNYEGKLESKKVMLKSDYVKLFLQDMLDKVTVQLKDLGYEDKERSDATRT